MNNNILDYVKFECKENQLPFCNYSRIFNTKCVQIKTPIEISYLERKIIFKPIICQPYEYGIINENTKIEMSFLNEKKQLDLPVSPFKSTLLITNDNNILNQ